MQRKTPPVSGNSVIEILTLTLTGLLFLAACGTTPQVRYYLISAQPVEVLPDAQLTEKVIGLGPVLLPEYLSRPHLVTRDSANRIRYDEGHRWAEPLAENIPRVLRENLAVLFNASQILAWPWPRTQGVDYRITLDITRLDAGGNGMVSMEGRWSLQGEEGRTLIAGQPVNITVPAADTSYESVAAAHSEALMRLCREIAKSVATLRATQ